MESILVLFMADHLERNKKNFQIGNKILLNWKSKNENKIGYFNVETYSTYCTIIF